MRLLESEQEWLATSDPNRLIRHALRHTPEHASDRKLILIQVGIAHRVWPLLADPRSRAAVEVAERSADRLVAPGEVEAARQASLAAYQDLFDWRDRTNPAAQAAHVAFHTVWRNNPKVWQDTIGLLVWLNRRDQGRGLLPRKEQAAVVRDVLGNPFRPVALSPGWLSSTAVGLARHIHESRDFATMPFLADALEDAGCADEQLLDHCRGPGPHARGCWVVDLVLGKH